jgi:hypothetical protein
MPRTGRCAVPGKQYVVLREFSRTDPKTAASASYKAGDPYSGSVDDTYLDSKGPDGKGPLLAEKSSPTPAPSSNDSSSKEKS